MTENSEIIWPQNFTPDEVKWTRDIAGLFKSKTKEWKN